VHLSQDFVKRLLLTDVATHITLDCKTTACVCELCFLFTLKSLFRSYFSDVFFSRSLSLVVLKGLRHNKFLIKLNKMV